MTLSSFPTEILSPIPDAVEPRIRVVHLVTTLNIGGLEMLVLDMLRYRAEHIEARVICLQEAGALAPRFAPIGVPVETVGGRRSIVSRLQRLARRLREIQPDVLHTHNPGPHLHGTAVRRIARIPVFVHTKHGRNYPARRYSVTLNRMLSMRTDCIVPVSYDAAKVALETEGVPAAAVHVVHNGIDIRRYRFRPPRADRREWRAITVARLHPVKDQATMIRAARMIVNIEPGFQLEIVGDGESRARLENLIAGLGLGRNVHLRGFQNDIPAHLAEADYFVLSSTSEGISLTLLEAMASGLPAVATDVGGNREVVTHGETGYLVPSRSPMALADAMIRLQSDEEMLRRMSFAARCRVEEEFDVRVMVQQYERLYAELLGRRRAVN